MKMHVTVQGSSEFELDAEFAAPAIAAAISGESGEDVRSEIIGWTDAERSDIDRDEYVTVTGDDGQVLWSGWLDSGKDGDPAPGADDDGLEAANVVLRDYLMRIIRVSGEQPVIALATEALERVLATTPLGAAEDIADGLVTLSADELRDVLLVVGEDVTPEAIARWSEQERADVARYAATEHLHASDNPVVRLPRPAVLGGDRA